MNMVPENALPPDVYLLLDENGEVLDANHETCRLVGASAPEALLGVNWISKFVPADQLAEVKAAFLRGLSVEGLHTFENEVCAYDGTRRLVRWFFVPRTNSDKRQIEAYGTDLTAIRDAAPETNELKTFPLDNPNPVLRVKTDGNIIFVNKAAQEVVEIAGDSLLQLVSNPSTTHSFELDVDGRQWLFAGVRHEHFVNLYGTEVTEQRSVAKRLVDARTEALGSVTQVLARISGHSTSYSGVHQRRVSETAVAIGEECGMDAFRLQGLRVASSIHDIGYVSVPSALLNRASPLSPEELLVVRSHAVVGADLLGGLGFGWPIADIVRQHHERMDGSGYPLALSGDAILIEARIIAVADTYEAMTSHRPHRPSLGERAAFDEIRDGLGAKYDSVFGGALLSMVDNGYRAGSYRDAAS